MGRRIYVISSYSVALAYEDQQYETHKSHEIHAYLTNIKSAMLTTFKHFIHFIHYFMAMLTARVLS